MNFSTAGEQMAKRKRDAEEVKPRKKKRRLRKLLFLGIVGGGVALFRSEDLRSKVLDKLFGTEKEFSYSPAVGDAGAAPDAGTSPDA
jgi:hypothetical protein